MTQTIFVTGASGFLGSHVGLEVLNKGYHIRAAARGKKVVELTKNCEKFGDKFHAIEIADTGTDQCTGRR